MRINYRECFMTGNFKQRWFILLSKVAYERMAVKVIFCIVYPQWVIHYMLILEKGLLTSVVIFLLAAENVS